MSSTSRLGQRMRLIGAGVVLAMSGCSCGAADPEVRWPASPDVQLDEELAATARSEGRQRPLSSAGETIEGTELTIDAPNIRARSFVFEGLWVAEVELGQSPEGAELPLVMMLHGRGDRPRVPGGPFGRVPTPMRVILPRGPLRLGEGYAWARHSVTENRHEELAADLRSAARRLVRLLRHVARTRPTAGSPVVTGFSQGAMVAWTIAVRYPDSVGLAIPIAGWVPPEARPRTLRASPTRSMHGAVDPIVRIEPTRAWVRMLRDAGNEVIWREYEGTAHLVTPEMNELFEDWLEEAMAARAPALDGGLGQAGDDPEPMEDYEAPLDIDPDEEAVPAPLPDEAAAWEEAPVDGDGDGDGDGVGVGVGVGDGDGDGDGDGVRVGDGD